MLTLKYTFKDGSISYVTVSEKMPIDIVRNCGDTTVEIWAYYPGITIEDVMG